MKDLTSGKEIKLLVQFATPMLIGNVFQQLYNIIDRIIVGKFLGADELAAVGSSFPIIFSFIALIIGIASGGNVVIAQYFGAKKIEEVKKSINTLFIFLFFASLIATFAGIFLSTPLFRLLKLPEALIQPANSYLHIFMGGMIMFFGFNGVTAILRGLGDSKTPLYFLIISTIVNIVLDLLFILVFKWGIKGAAFATVIAQGGAFFTAIIYLNKTHSIVKFSFRNLSFDFAIFKKIVNIGLPTGIQQTFVAVGMMALSGIVNLFGTNVIAAYTAAGTIDGIAATPAMTLSQALATFTGQNIGAGKQERVKKGLRATLIIGSLYSLFISVLAISMGDDLIRMFTNNEEVIRIGAEYLIIVGLFYIIFTTMFTYNGVLRGAGATLVPMFVTLFSLWLIRIPLAYLLSGIYDETGIWWAIPIAWFFGMVGAFLYYKSGKWKNKGVFRSK